MRFLRDAILAKHYDPSAEPAIKNYGVVILEHYRCLSLRCSARFLVIKRDENEPAPTSCKKCERERVVRVDRQHAELEANASNGIVRVRKVTLDAEGLPTDPQAWVHLPVDFSTLGR